MKAIPSIRGVMRVSFVLTLGTSLVHVQAGAAAEPYIRVSTRDPRYFEQTDGAPYIPIGLNLIAPPGRDLAGMDQWMQQLSANGGSFIRVWLSNPYFDVEHEHSGLYDPAKAQRIAEMLAAARRHRLRVKLCLEHFRHLGDGRQAWAAKPLHLLANGGTATNIADFFNGEPSRVRFRQKLSWYAQRFGREPTVFGWELWNEINAVAGGDYLAWTEAMLPELRRLFPSNLCMQSLGSFDDDRVRSPYRRLAQMPDNDVAQVHRYLDLGANLPICRGPVHLLAADAVRELLAVPHQRPVLLAESGAVEPRHTGPFKLYARDTHGLILHDVLFAPFFAGAAGPGHIWHWDAYVARNNLWYHFHRFAEAVRGIDPAAEAFDPAVLPHERLHVAALRGKRTWLLWCRDPRADWRHELAEGLPPDTVAGATLDFAGLPRPFEAAIAECYDPWRNQRSPAHLAGPRLALPDFQRSLVVRVTLSPGLQ